jgi:hypothetical protein
MGQEEWPCRRGRMRHVLFCCCAAISAVVTATEAEKGDTPPLDVLIVWHAYMLNTAAYRKYENHVLKGRMGLKGINWAAVVSCLLQLYMYNS